MSSAYYAQDHLYDDGSDNEDTSSVMTDYSRSTLDALGKPQKSYPSGPAGTFIRDAETGGKTNYKVGSRDERRYFKVINSTAKNPEVFFYQSPDRYVRHQNMDFANKSQEEQEQWSILVTKWHNTQTIIRSMSGDKIPDKLCTYTPCQSTDFNTETNVPINTTYVPPISGSAYTGDPPSVIGAYYTANNKKQTDSFSHHRGQGLSQTYL
jgi:hypothetical protein